MSSFFVAVVAILLHVVNYNVTAQIEYNTRFFTKILGKNAVYYYAVYLVLSALLRDYFIQLCLDQDQSSLPFLLPLSSLGSVLFVAGFLLNLWTLKALGIKGMYNGDSFGHLFDAPVTDGPYQYFSDPQYVGTVAAYIGSAIYYASFRGFVLSVWMGLVFYVSVKFVEGPHMNRIYSKKNESKRKSQM